jgi:nuclear protein localization family protein 4
MSHPENSVAVEHLFASGGWQTLLAIASSSGANGRMETPSAAFDAMGINSPAGGNGGGGEAAADLGAGGGERVCPHCTFVNDSGRSDCEICGLPLDG